MKVFKFGGASVKDPDAVRNIASLLARYENKNLLVVISAMAKTTNGLEAIWRAFYNSDPKLPEFIATVKNFHVSMVDALFSNVAERNEIMDTLENVFVELDWIIEEEPHPDKSYTYDQIVSLGELLSTHIVTAYLKSIGLKVKWLDARNYIATDNSYRDATVDMDKTSAAIAELKPELANCIGITQGFIGSTSENFTSTLGREGSDYSAALFAYGLDAESLTIWKDVPGVLSADPKLFPEAKKISELPYAEALEMTYYGATVIHPKTIKPLQNKGIPLFVKAFNDAEDLGTMIGQVDQVKFAEPSIIIKQNQMLLSISTKDFSFIAENNLAQILSLMSKEHIKMNLMQNSAMTVSCCIDHDEERNAGFIAAIAKDYKLKYNAALTLITIRHYNEEIIASLLKGKELILEQRSRNTIQLVVRA
jgi:aspartate kinase